jgi:hypothetical protein
MSKKKKKGTAVEFIPADNYVRIWRSMLESPAYRVLSGLARQVLACLEVEHLRHGGRENGRLICPYARLMDYCCTTDKPAIARAVAELKAAGFIDFRPGRIGPGTNHAPNEYRLTYIPVSDDRPATNEWANIQSLEGADEIVGKFIRKGKRGRSEWFKSAANDKKLKSGVKPKKQITSGSHVPTGTPSFPVATSQPQTEISGSHVPNSYLDAIHIYPPKGGEEKPDSAASPTGSQPISAPDNSNGNGPAKNSANGNGYQENSATENSNGHPPPMASENPPWLKSDGDWFRANPDRQHRVRRLFEAEAVDLETVESPRTQVIVRMVKAGERRRLPFYWLDGTVSETEIAGRAMFDLIIEKDGYLPTWQQYIERVQRYCAEEEAKNGKS